ncbi:hypothetical protein HAX54_046813, partial [Datura stramonium]|nr:hypothetical protein [Datura stramonium]
VSMVNSVAQINLSPEEMIEAQITEAERQAKEARLAEVVRRSEAANFASSLEERNRQNPPRHHERNTLWNVLFEGEFQQEEVGYTGSIVPPPLPANAMFDMTSTM